MNCFNNMDNMGGILSAKFVLLDEVKYFAPVGNACKVGLHDHKIWKEFEHQPESIRISVKGRREAAGLIYDITGSIALLKSDLNLSLLRLSEYILIQYINTDQVTKIIGTAEYPLRITLNPLTPSSPSGFHGWELLFEGKQLIEPPTLII